MEERTKKKIREEKTIGRIRKGREKEERDRKK